MNKLYFIDPEQELERILSYPIFDARKISSIINLDNIVLYGAGSMGRMALDLMLSYGVKPIHFIDEKVSGKISDVDVKALSELTLLERESITFIICIVTQPLRDLIDFLQLNGCKKILHFYQFSESKFPQIMGNGWQKPYLTHDEIKIIKQTILVLKHDDFSIRQYMRYLWWRLRGVDMQHPSDIIDPKRKYFDFHSFPILHEAEVFLDVGAHFGDLSKIFIEKTNGRFSAIHAFEPDKKNFKVLEGNPYLQNVKIHKHKKALYSQNSKVKFIGGLGYASKIDNQCGGELIEAVTLDSISNIAPTIMKLHVEGSEYSALIGSIEKIKLYRPIIMVVSDHNLDGIFKIPKFLMELEGYQINFSYTDYCGNTSIFYAYPLERIRKL